MKGLRNIFGLLKRHYEKVILGLALVGLIWAVGHLNGTKSEQNKMIEDYDKGITKRKPKPIPQVDLAQLTEAMKRATKPLGLDLSPPHQLFNPVKWQQRPDGFRIKAETGKELGVNAVVIAKLSPLNLLITLDSQAGSGAQMSVTQEASTNRFLQQRLRAYVTTNNPSERVHSRGRAFTLRDYRVTPEGPEADIELADGKMVTVTPSKPFERVEGYKADLHYPPENQAFKERRVGDSFTVAGEDYIIVAISSNEVVVSARSNDRRTPIRSNATP